MDDRPSSAAEEAIPALPWSNCAEILRLGLAGVCSRGGWYRMQLLRKAINPIATPPLEIGIDPRPMVYLAWKVEKRETAYRTICAFLLVAGLMASNFSAALLIPILIIAAVVCGIHDARHRATLQVFSKGAFTLKRVQQLLASQYDPRLDAGIGSNGQRVVVYKDFDPFGFAGMPIGKWSFTVDVERPAQSGFDRSRLIPVSLSEIDDSIRSAIQSSSVGDLVVRKVLAVHGDDAHILPMISHEPNLKQPNVNLSEDAISDFAAEHPTLARCYLLVHDIRWNGRLIVTHVVRTSLQGRIFYIEVSRFCLTPPSKEFKAVDATNFFYTTIRTRVGSFVFGAIASPFKVIGETYNLFAFATIWRRRKRMAKHYWRSLEDSPVFNYGAEESTRRQMMDEKFDHFFQKADLDFVLKAFDQTIVELVCAYMEEHGIDVSALRDKVTTIYNSGILVQGGDVTAQAVAVGQGSTAQTNSPPKNPLNTKAKE